MHLTTFFALWSLVALVFSKAIQHILTKRRHAALARDLGCQPAPSHTPGDPLGMYNLYMTIKALNKHYIPELMLNQVKAVSQREGRVVTTFRSMNAGERRIFTCEPRNIQAILATQFKDFELGAIRNGSFQPMLGHGIFASDGKQWERSRAMLRPQFARDQINDLGLEEMHVRKMMHVLPFDSDSSGWTDAFDIQPLFFRLTIDTATEFLFGESVDSQLGVTPGHKLSSNALQNVDEQAFTNAFDLAQWYMFRAARLGKAFRLGHTPDFQQKVKEVHAFVDYYVQLALNPKLREKALEEGSNRTTTTTGGKRRYIFLEALSQTSRDPVELRDHLLNILLAGRDTTASLLSWAFFVLARHPNVFARLRRAVLDDFGSYDRPRNITFARLKACGYLQHTLAETLRMYAVVPVNERAAAVDTTLPVGGGLDGKSPVFVPKGTHITYSVHAMHKRKDLWGEDAEEFRPERWENRKHGWEYLPFNGGPRICIGQQFALTEAGYVIVRLLQRFDALEAVNTEIPTAYRMTLTCAPAYGVKVRLREAKL